jgi:hypothetical protein
MPDFVPPGVYYQESVPEPQLNWIEPVETFADLSDIDAQEGCALIVLDENTTYVFDGSGWCKVMLPFSAQAKAHVASGGESDGIDLATHLEGIDGAIAGSGLGLTGGGGTALTLAADGGLQIPDTSLKLKDPIEVARYGPPGPTDDIDAGFVPGSKWNETGTGTLWVCTNATPGKAEWLNAGSTKKETPPTKAKRLVKFGEDPHRKLSPEEE